MLTMRSSSLARRLGGQRSISRSCTRQRGTVHSRKAPEHLIEFSQARTGGVAHIEAFHELGASFDMLLVHRRARCELFDELLVHRRAQRELFDELLVHRRARRELFDELLVHRRARRELFDEFPVGCRALARALIFPLSSCASS